MKFYREAIVRVRLRKGDFSGYYRTIQLSGLRVAFSIQKSLAWSTNSGIIRIWNLSQDHRNLIKDYGDEVTLYAGYQLEGGPQVIYIGDTTAVSHVYEQPEIVTILECGDGEKFINQLRVSISFAENSSAEQIIRSIAMQMGITLNIYAAPPNLIYRQGFKFIGMGKDALTLVCDKLGLQWSVQNNALQVIPNNGTITLPIIHVNEQTGMQGIPQRFTYKRLDLYRPVVGSVSPNQAPTAPSIPPCQPTGYRVNVALNTLIIPGSKIDLASTHLNFRGPYRVENVRHEGDTYGFLWQSNLEVTELQGATQ